MDKELWIVGQWIECGSCNTAWEFIGCFDDKQLAIEACVDEDYFIGPAIVNKSFPQKSIPWPDAYYPLLEDTSRFPKKEKVIKDFEEDEREG